MTMKDNDDYIGLTRVTWKKIEKNPSQKNIDLQDKMHFEAFIVPKSKIKNFFQKFISVRFWRNIKIRKL